MPDEKKPSPPPPAPPPQDVAVDSGASTPIEHLTHALELVKTGQAVQFGVNVEDKAALAEHIKTLSPGDQVLAKKLVAGEVVQIHAAVQAGG